MKVEIEWNIGMPNETIQGIPNKCINALDAWVESLNKEDKIE